MRGAGRAMNDFAIRNLRTCSGGKGTGRSCYIDSAAAAGNGADRDGIGVGRARGHRCGASQGHGWNAGTAAVARSAGRAALSGKSRDTVGTGSCRDRAIHEDEYEERDPDEADKARPERPGSLAVNGSCWSDSSSVECRQKCTQVHDCFLSSAFVWRDTKAQGDEGMQICPSVSAD
jgi:hypothetical protein